MDSHRLGTVGDVLSGSVSRRAALRGLAGGGAAAALLAGAGLGRVPVAAQEQTGTPETGSPPASNEVTLEWFTWSNFRLTSPTGKVLLLNPWVVDNPDTVVGLDAFPRADLILASQGHRDDYGSSLELAQQTGGKVLVPFELGTWTMEQGLPQEQVIRSNPGWRYRLDDIVVRVLGAVHGASLPAPTPTTPYGGVSASFMITFENTWTVYFDGNSAATQDMALWARLYQPDAVIFNMSVAREPMDAALTISLLTTDNPNLKAAIPHHHRTTPPPGATSVAEVQAALDTLGVAVPLVSPVPLEVIRFAK